MSLNENKVLADKFDAQISANAEAAIAPLLVSVQASVATLYKDAVAPQFGADSTIAAIIDSIAAQAHQAIHVAMKERLGARMQDEFTARLLVASLVENEV